MTYREWGIGLFGAAIGSVFMLLAPGMGPVDMHAPAPRESVTRLSLQDMQQCVARRNESADTLWMFQQLIAREDDLRQLMLECAFDRHTIKWLGEKR